MTGVIAALVLAGLSVGAAVPSYAAVPVTASGSKTLILAKAGIVSVPNQIGGMTGMVPSCGPCLLAPAAAGGVMEVLNAVGAAYTIQQIVEGIGKMFTTPASLSTNGTPAATVTVNQDVVGAPSTPNYTNSVGSKSCLSSDPSKCATIYAVVPATPGGVTYCAWSNYKKTGAADTRIQWTPGPLDTGGSAYVAAPADPGRGCGVATSPAGAVGLVAFAGQFNGEPASSKMISWNGDVSGGAGWTGAVTPLATIGSLPGNMKSQLWCQNPQDAGGALVDYTIAQAMSLEKGQTVSLQPQTCPVPGAVAVDKKVSFVPTDTTKAPVPIVNPRGTDPTTYSKQKTTAIQYPQCAAGGCTVDLRKINGDPCGTIGQGCPDWVSDPNYATKYQCFYGGSQVDIGYCSMYRAPKTGVQPNVDDSGNLIPVTAPPLADPGQPVKPGTTEPVPVENNDPKGCAPSSVIEMLNPFALFGAITCAMQNMFVPDPVKIQTSVQGVQDSWSDTPFVKVSGMVSSVAASVPANQNGCSGISFTFPAVLGVAAQNFSVLNACTEPLAGVAALVRTIGSIGIIFAGIMALTKMAGGVINLPGMGKSGD